MDEYGRFEEKISVTLKRDEAIVLFWYLTRELWKEGEQNNLRASFIHGAEPHSLDALLQELIPPLLDTGAPDAKGIEARGPGSSIASIHLMNALCSAVT